MHMPLAVDGAFHAFNTFRRFVAVRAGRRFRRGGKRRSRRCAGRIQFRRGVIQAVHQDWRMRQQAAQLFPQMGGGGGNVAFSQQDAVSGNNLLHPDGMLLREHLRTIDGIDDGADMPDAELVTEHGVGLERSDNGCRLGQAGGFDDDALEMGNLPARPLVEQIEQRLFEFAAYLAAQAAGTEQDGIRRDGRDELLVDADFAEFVNQHGAVAVMFGAEDFLQQRGFAGAEKAGEDDDRRFRGRRNHGEQAP